MFELFKKKNVYFLMHQDIPVLSGQYDTDTHAFSSITILNEAHLPYGGYHNGKFSLKALNHWLYWRGIPSYRVGLDFLLDCLGTKSSHRLLEYTHHLSVSDTYWLKKDTYEKGWDEINYWHRSYDQNSFARASFSSIRFEAPSSAKRTPNNTLNGFQRKSWMVQDGNYVLYKGGTPLYQEEPVNEWLASRIAEVLGIPHTHYDLTVYEGRLVSVCRNMCDENTDLIPARDLLGLQSLSHEQFQLDPYEKMLINSGITDAKQRMDDMMLLDYLLLNTDRHDQNMGILVDARTMQWKQVAPVFDTGTGLGALVSDRQVLNQYKESECRLLNAKHFSHRELLQLISDLNRYDFNALKDIPEEYGNMLVRYQSITNITDYRINALYQLLYKQIQYLTR